jgi:diacylglycerol kinase (ATP)
VLHDPEPPSPRLFLRKRLKSFGYAFQGLGFMLRTQHNAWVHGLATVVVIVAGWWFHVTTADWRWLICAIAMVWFAEAFNTALEYACDVVSPQHSEAVKRTKDIAAGAVLICALAAAFIGGVTFWPYATAR